MLLLVYASQRCIGTLNMLLLIPRGWAGKRFFYAKMKLLNTVWTYVRCTTYTSNYVSNYVILTGMITRWNPVSTAYDGTPKVLAIPNYLGTINCASQPYERGRNNISRPTSWDNNGKCSCNMLVCIIHHSHIISQCTRPRWFGVRQLVNSDFACYCTTGIRCVHIMYEHTTYTYSQTLTYHQHNTLTNSYTLNTRRLTQDMCVIA